MIDFKTISFRNFFSYGSRDINLSLDSHYITLLHGDSGSGKSTVVSEAITFALFGKPFRKIKKGDVVNSVNGKDCYIEVVFTIGSDDFKIVRGIKPDIFEIFKNGSLINQNPSVRDYQKHLEENIICMSYKTWCQIVILGFANHTPFMLLSANDRRQMVDEVLGVEVFQKMLQIAKESCAVYKADILAIESEITAAQSSIQIQKANLQKIREHELEKEEQILAEIAKLDSAIAKLHEDDLKIANNISTHQNTLEIKKKEEVKYKKMVDLFDKLEYSFEQIQAKIDFFENNESCPTCNQHIDDSYKSDIISNETVKHTELKSALQELKSKIRERENIVNEIEDILNDISTLEKTRAINQNTIEHYQTSITNLHSDIKKELICDNSVVSSINESIDSLLKNIDLLSEKKREYSVEFRHMMICSTLLKDDGIKGKIISMYLPILTRMVNDLLEQMNFMMRISFDENFSETIYARFRDKLTFSQLSQGEQSRINIAIVLAWRQLAEMRNSIKTSILVLDELLDSTISASDVESVINMIKKISQDQHLFIISHTHEKIVNYCDRVIRFEKRGNFSQMEEY